MANASLIDLPLVVVGTTIPNGRGMCHDGNNGLFFDDGAKIYSIGRIHGDMPTLVPVTTNTIALGSSADRVLIAPAGTLAALTINPPTSPYNGQEVFIIWTKAITSLTVTALDGSTLVNAPSSATINTATKMIYSSATSSWYFYT